MRQFLVLALLLLCLSFAHTAHAQAQPGADDTIGLYLSPGERYTTEAFMDNGTAHLAVKVGGEYAMLFEHAGGKYRLILEKPRIYQVFWNYKVSQLGVPGRVAQIRASLLSFNSSREPAEKQCKKNVGLILVDQDTGAITAVRECKLEAGQSVPLMSCMLACRSNPSCEPYSYGSMEFIYEILYLKTSTADLDSGMAELFSNLDKMLALDQQASDSALENMKAIEAAKNKLAGVKLPAYGLCLQFQLNSSALAGASQEITALDNDFNYLATIESVVADRVENFSSGRAALLASGESYKLLFIAKVSEINSNLDKARAELAPLNLTVNDSGLLSLINLANATANAGNNEAALAKYNQAVNASAQLVQNAQARVKEVNESLAEITKAEADVRNTEGSILFMLLRLDTSQSHALLAQARQVLYQDPAKAKQLAGDAKTALQPTTDSLATANYVIFSLLFWLLILGAGVLALAVFIWRRYRGSKAAHKVERQEKKRQHGRK